MPVHRANVHHPGLASSESRKKGGSSQEVWYVVSCIRRLHKTTEPPEQSGGSVRTNRSNRPPMLRERVAWLRPGFLSSGRLFGSLFSGGLLILLRRLTSPHDQFNRDHLGRIAYTAPRFNDSRIAALTLSEATGYVTEQLGHHRLAS